MAGSVYSDSIAGRLKRIYDVQIMEFTELNRARIDMKKGDYIKALIKLASKGMIEVKTLTSDLQFFLIIGGAEGFLSSTYTGIDASRIESTGTVTAGVTSTLVLDDSCMLAVFDKRGDLISSALLKRPLVVHVSPRPAGFSNWDEDDAIAVVDAWDKCKVGLYHNTNYLIKYFGLWIDDSKHYYTSGKKMVDFHKQEQTNGCIFIKDDATPPLPHAGMTPEARKAALTALDDFEPELIKAVQTKIGAKTKSELGTMRVVKFFR